MKSIKRYALLSLGLIFMLKIEKIYEKKAKNTIGRQGDENKKKFSEIRNAATHVMTDKAHAKEDLRETFPKLTKILNF